MMIKKGWCKICGSWIHIYKGRFVPHGDSLGPCGGSGKKAAEDEVLLTGQEAINSFCEKAPLSELANLSNDLLIKIGDGLKLVCIAQNRKSQLKLLEWLKERCEEHPILIPAEYGVIEPSGYAYVCRFECPECMTELESKLKEAGK